VKAGWGIKRLGDVCEIVKGRKPVLKATCSDGDLPYLVAKVMRGGQKAEYASTSDRNSVVVLQSETVIICDGSNSGEVFTGFHGILSSTMGKVVKKAEIDDSYLRAFLASTFDVFNGAKVGAAIPHLDKDAMYALEVPLPPLARQKQIVAVLEEAIAALAIAQSHVEKNRQHARALFESHLQAVFTQRQKGWVEATLGDVCEFVGGSQPPKSVFEKARTAENIRLIQIRDYKSDRYIVYIPRAQARRFCNADDVMIGRYGPPLFQILRGLDGAYNVALIKASPDETRLSRDFLFYFLKHSAIREYVIYHSERAAGQIGVTKETLEPYPIALPSLPDQDRIVGAIAKLESEAQRLECLYDRKQGTLTSLEKSLRYQAFSGAL
jgi:type I restriction enzyme, S subunit